MANPRSIPHTFPHNEQATVCPCEPLAGAVGPADGHPASGRPRVLFVTAGGWERASTRCRVLQYLPHLEDGWQVTHSALGTSEWSERRHRLGEHPSRLLWQRAARRLRYHWYRAHERRGDAARMGASARGRHDLVLFQKVVPPPAVLAGLNASGAALVYDFDDALFAGGGARPSGEERRFRRRLESCLRAMDLVITCSEFNRRYACQFASRVEELLTPVDVARYRPRPGSPAGRPVTVGWIGSPSTTPYLRWALALLRDVAAARPGARFLFLGAEPFPLEGLPGSFQSWQYETELQYLAEFDIGIMPVRPSDWANGKAGYKLLQYMSLGLPSVASPDGVNAEIVEEGVTGYLAADADTWRRRLIALIDDAELRSRMGAAARARAERSYSVECFFPSWRGLLESAMAAAQERRAAR